MPVGSGMEEVMPGLCPGAEIFSGVGVEVVNAIPSKGQGDRSCGVCLPSDGGRRLTLSYFLSAGEEAFDTETSRVVRRR